MRQETHEIVEDADKALRITLRLCHHIADSKDEVDKAFGWEIRELLFTFYPDRVFADGGPLILVLKQPTVSMDLIREWISGFNLDHIRYMLAIREYQLHDACTHMEFYKAKLRLDKKLRLLNRVSSFPFRRWYTRRKPS